MQTPYDEGLLCEDCAEAEYVRFWVEEVRVREWRGKRSQASVYRCPPDCPFYPPGRGRRSVSEPWR